MGEKTFLFVNVAIDGGYQGVHHGIAFLVPIVRKFGYEVSIFNMQHDMSVTAFREKIINMNCSVIGYSITSLQIKYLQKFSNAVSDLPSLLQIAGGSGATLQPDMPGSSVDGFCIGEGEIPLENLLRTIQENGDITQVNGFCWHQNGKIIRNSPNLFLNDLNSLDFPDYTLFDDETVVFGSDRCLSLMLSRGCPYRCSFCSNEVLRDVYETSRGYFRTPSVEYSLKLIEKILENYPQVKFIHFEDDLLIARKVWFLEFSKQYRQRIDLPYRMNVRTECLNPEIVRALKESGCSQAFLGVESGNEEYRRTMLHRNHSNAKIIEGSQLVKKAGIKLFTFNIVGFPHETKEQMLDTFRLNKQIAPDSGVCTFFYPFPGTSLYEISVKEGFIDPENTEDLPSNYSIQPLIYRTSEEKRFCIKIAKKIRNYLYLQDLKYKLHKYKMVNSYPETGIYFTRLIVYYFLRRLISLNLQRQIYSFFSANRFLRPLGALFLKGIR